MDREEKHGLLKRRENYNQNKKGGNKGKNTDKRARDIMFAFFILLMCIS
jgi:hypothetical protein